MRIGVKPEEPICDRSYKSEDQDPTTRRCSEHKNLPVCNDQKKYGQGVIQTGAGEVGIRNWSSALGFPSGLMSHDIIAVVAAGTSDVTL